MYLLGEQPAYADELINRLQAIPAQLLKGLTPCAAPLEFEQIADLGASLAADQVFLIDSGLLHARVDERALFYLHEGDLVGLRQGSLAQSDQVAFVQIEQGPLIDPGM